MSLLVVVLVMELQRNLVNIIQCARVKPVPQPRFTKLVAFNVNLKIGIILFKDLKTAFALTFKYSMVVF